MSHCARGKGEGTEEGENDIVKTGDKNTLSRGKEMRPKGHSERGPHDKKTEQNDIVKRKIRNQRSRKG